MLQTTVFLWAPTLVGTVVLVTYLLSVVSFITFHFLPFRNSLKKYQRQPRAWAIVTGSSEGIGFGHAQELARRGFGVIVLAHIKTEVNEAVDRIKAKVKGAVVEAIVLDANTASYQDISNALKPFMHLPITILINNVGMLSSSYLFTTFESYEPTDISKQINVNALFHCNITHVLYPVLKQNGPSLIMNVSSMAHSFGAPWITIYCGTKAFLESWSRSIAKEAKEEGHQIDSVAILPGDVRTRKNVYGVSASSPTPDEFGRMSLDRVDRAIRRGRLVFCPYWQHDLALAIANMLPSSVMTQASNANMRQRMIEEREARRNE